jgi:hypothetical protein
MVLTLLLMLRPAAAAAVVSFVVDMSVSVEGRKMLLGN